MVPVRGSPLSSGVLAALTKWRRLLDRQHEGVEVLRQSGQRGGVGQGSGRTPASGVGVEERRAGVGEGGVKVTGEEGSLDLLKQGCQDEGVAVLLCCSGDEKVGEGIAEDVQDALLQSQGEFWSGGFLLWCLNERFLGLRCLG
ncbi:hypothetical protein HYQ46_004151 [Verticillium longisporum]|nr:hypothetical protein HYQ46_004151 [Verticillium longisporum]